MGLHKEGGRREGRKEEGGEEREEREREEKTRKNCSGSSPEIPTQTQCIALFQGKSLFQASGTTQVFGGGGAGCSTECPDMGFLKTETISWLLTRMKEESTEVTSLKQVVLIEVKKTQLEHPDFWFLE